MSLDNFQIKFDDIDEMGIQAIIGVILEKNGYKVEFSHFSDRANEDGADLIAKSRSHNIAIQVKKKPSKFDTSQLLELNDRQEKKKIYVYTQTPTKKFLDFMKKCKKVEYWDLRKLNNFIYQENPYFFCNLLFSEHETIKKLEIIRYLFFQISNSNKNRKKKQIKEMKKESISMLWRLKDYSVTLNKIPIHTRFFFEEPLTFKNDQYNIHFLGLLRDFLDSLSVPTNNFFLWFLDYYKKNKNLVDNSIIEMSNRSHWFSLFNFDNKVNATKLIEDLERSKNIDEEWEKFKKTAKRKDDLELIKDLENSSKSNNIWDSIRDWLKQLNMIGYFLEECVDDILAEYLRDYTIRYDKYSRFIS